MESGSRTGQEFLSAWNSMKTEAEQCSQFLGSDQLQDGPLQEEAAGAGNGREDGGTRKLIVDQREELRAAVLGEALSRLRPPHNTSRPVQC